MRPLLSSLCGVTAILFLAFAGVANAATLGTTTQPAGSSTIGCGPGAVAAQVLSDPSTPYSVPGGGAITEWRTNSSADTPFRQVTLVVLRPVGASFTVVGVDTRSIPSPAPAVAHYPLATPIAVSGGETLGLYTNLDNDPVCAFHGGDTPVAATTTGLGVLVFGSPPAPGETLNRFGSDSPGGFTMNLAATFEPNNAFSFGGIKRNSKKGTALLTVNVPTPGELTASGNGVKAATAERALISKSVPAGAAQLLIKARGKKKKRLIATGKVKLNVAVTYTPAGGSAATQSQRVKLIKKR